MTNDDTYDDKGRVAIAEAPGWRFQPFETDGDNRTITVVREDDGCELTFTLPSIVKRGEELERIAAIVIGAQTRADRSEGLGA